MINRKINPWCFQSDIREYGKVAYKYYSLPKSHRAPTLSIHIRSAYALRNLRLDVGDFSWDSNSFVEKKKRRFVFAKKYVLFRLPNVLNNVADEKHLCISSAIVKYRQFIFEI